jgi:hypothetical protein
VPLAQVNNQPLFQVIPYPTQRLAAIAVVKVANPASDHGVDFVHDPFKGHDRPFSSRKFGNPVFDLLLSFLRWLDMGVMVPRFPAFPHPDREELKGSDLRN